MIESPFFVINWGVFVNQDYSGMACLVFLKKEVSVLLFVVFCFSSFTTFLLKTLLYHSAALLRAKDLVVSCAIIVLRFLCPFSVTIFSSPFLETLHR